MNRLDAMHLFVRIAESGSFTAVAEQMNLARSVVTRQIAALETHLGVKLMVRNTRRLSLTSAGSAYLEKCRVILDLVEAAEASVMEERLTPRGNIRIGLPLSFGLKKLSPLLLEFTQLYPDIHLEMDFDDRQMNLIEEGMDISIRIAGQLEPGDIVRKLGTCKLLTIASPDYLNTHGRPAHPSELSEHDCLGYTLTSGGASWTFDINGRHETFYINNRIKANNGDALTEAAAKGLGITRQPDFIVNDYLASGQVESILEAFTPKELGIYAILPSNRYIPHRVRVLLDFLAKKMEQKNSGKNK
ncbi:LysR family transcriptional regulator [Tolumonas lignilytica]|uniref:LysR family transcriptional regulator n=1 Tax=Tolumonas lignilytica TaxID=1283284 RepID=UPI000467A985|nr:LysR family transcriptional regulator [Tolumonas lignilytica]